MTTPQNKKYVKDNAPMFYDLLMLVCEQIKQHLHNRAACNYQSLVKQIYNSSLIDDGLKSHVLRACYRIAKNLYNRHSRTPNADNFTHIQTEAIALPVQPRWIFLWYVPIIVGDEPWSAPVDLSLTTDGLDIPRIF